MHQLEGFGIVPVGFSTVINALPGYKSGKDKVCALERSGKLLRLKKGLYVLPPTVSSAPLSRELIANHLYGPSCVSLESALSYHGLISERVYTVRSVAPMRSKLFTNALGTFEYVSVPEDYFSIGVRSTVIDGKYSFLMANQEKALCDLLMTTAGLRIQSKKAMMIWLEEDLRLDWSADVSWDLDTLDKCVEKGRKKRELRFLREALTTIDHG